MVNKFSCPADKISIWAVGIEELYSDRNTTYDCLIYSKRRSSEELEQVKSFLTKHPTEVEKVRAGVITSLPFLKPKASMPIYKAEDPELT